MRLGWSKSKNSITYYIQKSAYINGKRTTKIIERLGNDKYICETYNVTNAKEWALKHLEELKIQEASNNYEILIPFKTDKHIFANSNLNYNGGYLFLQSIYYKLGLDKICKAISKKYNFEYNLNSILSRIIYARIIYPSSKLTTFEESKKFIECPDFELQHIYRSLDILSKESDYIQSVLYKNTLKSMNRNDKIIYYDCTNYYFETEVENGLRQYGLSKQHQPLPIVSMGLFMDSDGIPLAFNINPGNTNEQITLKPLEEKLLSKFNMSKFVVCTDAGLSSNSNRKFNSKGNRAYITTQSIKKLKGHLKEWVLSKDGWHLNGCDKTFNLDDIKEDDTNIYYKDRWINENGLEEHLIVSFSMKHKKYQQHIRNEQLQRAIKNLNSSKSSLTKNRQNDYKRFITVNYLTCDGEIANLKSYSINEDLVAQEEIYDGFYGVCTNLESEAKSIIDLNKQRWEIEECFRIMKSDFKARPVYLQKDERIKAHFLTCFLSLIVYRYLEKEMKGKYTSSELIKSLKELNFTKLEGYGYIPNYSNTEIYKDLHKNFGFDTSYQIIPIKKMKNICSLTKKIK